MTLKTRGIVRFELTVADLHKSEHFYVDGLGFTAALRGEAEPAMAALLGAERIATVELHKGGQIVVLQAFQPSGSAYPADATSSNQVFQHFAIPVADMAASHARLQALHPLPISKEPQLLPERSGGATAFKFRDPEGHPLELIQFPDNHGDGIDHSAIVVADVDRSIAFYRDQLGFTVAARQLNTGPEQDRLDGQAGISVEVVALTPSRATPHLELLAYRHPKVRTAEALRPNDLAATRLVLEVSSLPAGAARLSDGTHAMLAHDPDGHALLLVSTL